MDIESIFMDICIESIFIDICIESIFIGICIVFLWIFVRKIFLWIFVFNNKAFILSQLKMLCFLILYYSKETEKDWKKIYHLFKFVKIKIHKLRRQQV